MAEIDRYRADDRRQVEALYRSLLDRPVDTPQRLERWLNDCSELASVVDEYGSRRYIDKSCHTDDPQIKQRFLDYVENIEPKLKPVMDELQKKFLASQHAGKLTGPRYEILKKKWKADVEIENRTEVEWEIGTDRVAVAQSFGVIESVKTASDLYAPAGGEIIAINEALHDKPELVNSDPYGDGWMIKMRLSNAADRDGLVDVDRHAADGVDHVALDRVLGRDGRVGVTLLERAAQLLPVSKDALDGPEWVINLGLIHAMLGNEAKAVEYYGQALAIPSWVSSNSLRRDPVLATLNRNPDFQRLLASDHQAGRGQPDPVVEHLRLDRRACDDVAVVDPRLLGRPALGVLALDAHEVHLQARAGADARGTRHLRDPPWWQHLPTRRRRRSPGRTRCRWRRRRPRRRGRG